MPYSLDPHHTQKAQSVSLAKLSSPKSAFQSRPSPVQDVKWPVGPLCLSSAALNRGEKVFRASLPFPTSSSAGFFFLGHSKLGRRMSPRLPSRVRELHSPAHSRLLPSLGRIWGWKVWLVLALVFLQCVWKGS